MQYSIFDTTAWAGIHTHTLLFMPSYSYCTLCLFPHNRNPPPRKHKVRHAPNVPLPLPGRKMEGKKSEETLQIRLYAVDCPEIAHFGNPAQPFSAEAKAVSFVLTYKKAGRFHGRWRS